MDKLWQSAGTSFMKLRNVMLQSGGSMYFAWLRYGADELLYFNRMPDARRVALFYWHAGLRETPVTSSPTKDHIHGPNPSLLLRICVALITSSVGATYSDHIVFAIAGMIGFIELGYISFCWLLEILCGRYRWRPRFEGRWPLFFYEITHSSEEPAWQHYFSETRLTRLCFAFAPDGDGYIRILLTSRRTAWLGWAICFLFLMLWNVMAHIVYSSWVWDPAWDYRDQ